MKLLGVLVFFAMVVLSSSKLLADAVMVEEMVNGKSVWRVVDPGYHGPPPTDDPRIAVRRLVRGSVPFKGFKFSFRSASGTGSFDFYNGNGIGLRGLTFTITPGGPAPDVPSLFECGVDSANKKLPYSNCRYSEFGDSISTTRISFFGASGLPPHSHFAIDLTGFLPGTLVSATAIPQTPEPGTIVLFLSGMGALMARRRGRHGSVG